MALSLYFGFIEGRKWRVQAILLGVPNKDLLSTTVIIGNIKNLINYIISENVLNYTYKVNFQFFLKYSLNYSKSSEYGDSKKEYLNTLRY
jgi:hypothetical protein